MKKLIILILVCFLCVLSISAVTPEADGYVYIYHGDMDGDKSYGVADGLLLLRALVNDETAGSAVADANVDGEVTLMDVLKIIRIVTGHDEAVKTADARYYPESHIAEWSADTVTMTVGTVTAEYSAAYADNGVFVTVSASGLSDADALGFDLQGVNSIMYADRRTVRFLCHGDGDYTLQRYFQKETAMQEESVSTPTEVNDTFYYLYEKNDGVCKVTVFASYDFLRVHKAYAIGKVRLLPTIYCSGEMVAYTENLTDATCPETWITLDTDGGFVRDDFDLTSFADSIPAESKYKDLQFLEELATIEPADGTLRTMVEGAPAFTDRNYCFEMHFFPRELLGKAYVYAPIAGTTVTVTKAGYVVLDVGESYLYDKINTKVTEAGWEPLLLAAGSPINKSTYRNNSDMVNWYVKYCEVGETISFGKYAIPFAEGETVPFAWETESATLTAAPSDSYYSLAERNWQGIPSVAQTNGGRLFASWVTGGTGEPQIGNYDVLAYSDDGGRTWTEYGVLDTVKSTDASKAAKVNDIHLWMDTETNTLYLFYVQSSTNNNFEKNSAVWLFTLRNPDADPAEWEMSEHRYLFPGLQCNDPIVLSDGTWLAAPNYYMDSRFSIVYASTDQGKTWEERGKAYIPQAINADETILTELSDGTVWMTVRTTKKVTYQSFSFDGGRTWTLGSATELPNCATRFQIFRLTDGTLVHVYNDSNSSRIKMTAALSYDDGATWTDGLLMYAGKSTYPDFAVAKDGTIHILFDSNRFKSGNSWTDENGNTCWGAIYHAALTKEQIAAGGTLAVSDLDIVSVLTE